MINSGYGELSDKLEALEKDGNYPFHMPGHKRRGFDAFTKAVYASDITEIDGFDDLHDAKDVIKNEQEYAAELFGAKESFFLINGSTSGILAALLCVGKKENKNEDNRILAITDGAHRAFRNGMYLADLEADEIHASEIEGKISDKYRAVYVTSPDYEGNTADIKKICKAAHGAGIPVIVDSAHGAHIELFRGDGPLSIKKDELKKPFPKGALSEGADIVIESLHKTLPAMTQTSILHVGKDSLIDIKRLKRMLGIVQSSSPSYILMRSITACIHYMEKEGTGLFKAYSKRLHDFYEETKTLKNITVYDENLYEDNILRDPGKIVLIIKDKGKYLYDILREEYKTQCEYHKEDRVLLMTSLMDTDEGFDRLKKALFEIDERIKG